MGALHKLTAVVVTTRPAGHGGSLCQSLRRRGLQAANLPLVRLAAAPDPQQARIDLERILRGADKVIFTSPAAVRHARALTRETAPRADRLAVGPSTARVLRAVGWGPVAVPARADSEGLLDMSALQQVSAQTVAIVGAEGGRKLLGEQLAQRGARVPRAYVYQRRPARWDARHRRLLDSAAQPFVLTATSAQAIDLLAERLPPAAQRALCAGIAVASSARLAERCRALGFERIQRADSAANRALISAIMALF